MNIIVVIKQVVAQRVVSRVVGLLTRVATLIRVVVDVDDTEICTQLCCAHTARCCKQLLDRPAPLPR